MARTSPIAIGAAITLVLLPLQFTHARQKQSTSGERLVVCMIRLEHADAEQLATILRPFESPQGSLTAYAPTNTLIIKDGTSIVNMLAEIIKGQRCTPIAPAPKSVGEIGLAASDQRDDSIRVSFTESVVCLV